MRSILAILAGVFGVFMRVWDWFFSPAKVKDRADREVDKAIQTHDEKTVNDILDRTTRP